MYCIKDDFVDYMAFRDGIFEEKIEECVSAFRRGEQSIQIEGTDLTDDEVQYIRKEVQRRISNE